MKPLILILTLALCPLAQAGSPSPASIPDKLAWEYVTQYVHIAFKDPYSVRDLLVGRPVLRYPLMGGPIWAVPFSCNGKNSFGAYIGNRRYEVLIARNGQIDWKRIQMIAALTRNLDY
jgi:hypothetical protein